MSRLRENRWVKPIAGPVTDYYLETLLVAFAAIVFTFFATKSYVPMVARLAVPFLMFALVFARDNRLRALLLFWVTAGLTLNLIANFYVSANHGFMITYIGAALMIACAAPEDQRAVLLQRAAVLMLSILMGLALIQKLISPYYLSGELIGSYLATGQMFKVLLSLVIPDWFAIVAQNVAAEAALMADPAGARVPLTIPPLVQFLAISLSFTALASQAGLEIMILLRNRLGIWTHYAVMLFVLIIYSTRNENVFLSMNLILGYAMTTEETKSARLWYVLGIVYLLSMELMGLRPGIIG